MRKLAPQPHLSFRNYRKQNPDRSVRGGLKAGTEAAGSGQPGDPARRRGSRHSLGTARSGPLVALGRAARWLGVGVFVGPWAQISFRERLKTRLRPDSRVGGVRSTQGSWTSLGSPPTQRIGGGQGGKLRVNPPGQGLAWGRVLHTCVPCRCREQSSALSPWLHATA